MRVLPPTSDHPVPMIVGTIGPLTLSIRRSDGPEGVQTLYEVSGLATQVSLRRWSGDRTSRHRIGDRSFDSAMVLSGPVREAISLLCDARVRSRVLVSLRYSDGGLEGGRVWLRGDANSSEMIVTRAREVIDLATVLQERLAIPEDTRLVEAALACDDPVGFRAFQLLCDRHREAPVPPEACEAILRRAPESTRGLLQTFRERQLAIVRAAHVLGGHRAEPILVPLLAAPSTYVRTAAASALADCGSVGAVVPLLAAEKGTIDVPLRSAIRRAIVAIQARVPGGAAGQLSVAEAARNEDGALSLDDMSGALSSASRDRRSS